MNLERSSYDILAARIDRLEQQSNLLKRLLGISLVVILALFAGGATIAQQRQLSFSGPNGTVRVNGGGIALYDKSGRQRMILGWNEFSQPALYYLDGSGTARMALYLAQNHPVMRLYDRSGETRSDFGLTETDKPTLTFYDAKHVERVHLAQADLDHPYLRFYDAMHVERAFFGQSTTDNPLLELFDSSHTLRSFAGSYISGGNPVYGLFSNDSAGTTTWQVP